MAAPPSLLGGQILGPPELPRKKRSGNWKPGVREKLPRDRFKNLRDHGRSCRPDLRRIIWKRQQAEGYAWFTEGTTRAWVGEDNGGFYPGVNTIPAALNAFERAGTHRQIWLLKGGVMPDGSECRKGVRLVRELVGRAEKRAALADYAKRCQEYARGRRETRRDVTDCAPTEKAERTVDQELIFHRMTLGVHRKTPAPVWSSRRGPTPEELAAIRAELELPAEERGPPS